MKAALKILLTVIALTSTSYAKLQPYVGVGAALMKSQNSFEAKVSNIQTAGTKTINVHTTGYSEHLLLGVKSQQDCFFLGGEVFVAVHQFNVKRMKNVILGPNPAGVLFFQVDPVIDLEVDQKSSGGITFLMGKDLTPHLDVFFKLDFLWSQFAIKYRNSNVPSIVGQERKWLFGYAPGVGVELHLTDSLSTRLDYSYKIYNEFRTKNISQDTAIANSNVSGALSPRIHQFALSLIYKFW